MATVYRHDETPYPASGGWMQGDPVGHRLFHTFATTRPFSLEGGESLHNVTIAYETLGTLNADASNAILVCHAWTGDSHVAGSAGKGHPTNGWWMVLLVQAKQSTQISISLFARTCSVDAKDQLAHRRRIQKMANRTLFVFLLSPLETWSVLRLY